LTQVIEPVSLINRAIHIHALSFTLSHSIFKLPRINIT
jgi:hypothetical protein